MSPGVISFSICKTLFRKIDRLVYIFEIEILFFDLQTHVRRTRRSDLQIYEKKRNSILDQTTEKTTMMRCVLVVASVTL